MMRLTLVDFCGVPVTGVGSCRVTTDGFISVQGSPDVEDGEEILVKNAAGAPCVIDKSDPFVKRETVTVEMCQVNPDAVGLMAQARIINNGADNVGYAIDSRPVTNRFTLELWQPVSGNEACDPSGTPQYFYWAFPNLGAGHIGDQTAENGPMTLTVECESKGASPLWGQGPDMVDGPWTPEPVLAGEHFLKNFTTNPPPSIPEDCGCLEI
jgi:hypothetical protein